MIFKKRLNANLAMLIGMWFLVLALNSRYVLRSVGLLNEAWSDGFMGCLFGIAIGSLVLSMRLRRRAANRPSDS